MNFYDIEVKDAKGQSVSLDMYRNQVLLIVNTATECEFTEQYDQLEDLYDKYHTLGFTILDFPCNQFGKQAPGTMEEIISYCADNYGVSFPQFEKIEVNGEHQSPVYHYLTQHQDASLSKRIEWNFTKFLVDRQGQVIARFEPLVTPYEIEAYIEKCL